MADDFWFLLLPVLVQLAAAVFAVRLISITGKRLPWVLISTGLLVMALRRLLLLLDGAGTPPGTTVDAWLSLVISLLMLAGVLRIGPFFAEARDAARAAQRSSEELAASEARHRSLIDLLPEAVVVLRRGRIVFANRAFSRIFGVQAEEASGITLEELIAPEHRDRLRAWQPEEDAAINGWPHVALDRQDGERRWIELRAHQTGWDNEPAVVAIVSDVTERRHMTAALRESEEKFRSLAETAASAIFVFQDDRFRWVNQAAVELSGFSRDELLGMHFWDLVHPDHRELVRSRGFARQRGEQPPRRYQFKVQRRDGQTRWLDFTAGTIHFEGKLAGLGTAFDVTASHDSAEALRESRRALATLLSNLPGMAFRCANDEKWTMEFVSEGCAALTGFPPAELIGNARVSFADIIHADDRQRVWEEIQAGINARDSYRISYRIVTAQGEERWVWEQGRAIRDGDGALEAIEGFIADVTERRRAEEALRESEERFRSLFDNATVGIYRTSPDGRVLVSNPALLRMLKVASFEELAKRNLERDPVYHSLDRGVFRARIEREGEIRGMEAAWLAGDGSVVWVRESARAVRDANGTTLYYEGTVEDITERKGLEEQLRHAQKMETVGRLAGGIAHDLNNLLTPIMTGAEMLQRRLGADVRAGGSELGVIRRAAGRAADLTQKLLAFARRQVLQPIHLDLNQAIAGMLPMLRRLISETVTIDFVPGHGLGTVRADPAQLEQVVINLLTNAADAMPGGGRTTIETANVVLSQTYTTTHPWAVAGRYVLLTVTDTGSGMDEQTVAHAFEPFFTTKELGRGTGLGLATVYGIVKQHAGMIHVYSEPGRGTCFKLYLPVVAHEAESIPDEAEGPVIGGGERILVVEDDPEVRGAIIEVLTGLGYEVHAAGDGCEALDFLGGHAGEIDLVITDVVMPRMGGVELCRAAADVAPGASFLLSSGYSETVVAEQFLAERSASFIPKPYGIDTLARKVRQVLDARRVAAPSLAG